MQGRRAQRRRRPGASNEVICAQKCYAVQLELFIVVTLVARENRSLSPTYEILTDNVFRIESRLLSIFPRFFFFIKYRDHKVRLKNADYIQYTSCLSSCDNCIDSEYVRIY